MSAQDTLGKIIDDKEQRDAIHIALAPVVASQRLLPGEDIGFVGSNPVDVGRKCAKHIGIVDPFLKEPVKEGERFWMFLYPNTISSLRHEWTHPDFLDASKSDTVQSSGGERKATSISWLTDYAKGVGLSYQEIIDGANDYLTSGDYIIDGGRYEGEYVPDEFWDHYEIATGKKVEEKQRGSFFSCSC